MQPGDVGNTADARATVEQRGLDFVRFGLSDVDGIMRGKYMSRDKFFSALEGGFGFCDVVPGWDSKDQLYDNVKLAGRYTGYGDAEVRIVPESCRAVPFEGDMLLFLAEFLGPAEQGTVRRPLRRDPRMGREGVPQAHHGPGDGPQLRDRLTKHRLILRKTMRTGYENER